MTLGELLTVLDESGLRTRPAAPAGRDGGARPDCRVHRVRLPGRDALGAVRRGEGGPGGRRGLRRAGHREGRRGRRGRGWRPGGVPGPVDHRQRRAPGARAPRVALPRRPEPADARGRHHRHQRQDHHVVPRAGGDRGRRHPVRPDGHGAVPGRPRRARRGADHAGGPGRAADAARDARRRLRGVRHGGLVARAGAQARRRHPLRRGGLHEPDARPSRLPRRHGAVLRRQAAAVRRCCRTALPPW